MSTAEDDLPLKYPLRLIHGLARDECVTACVSLGQSAYRASQIWNWLYRHYVTTWDSMTNLPSTFRAGLASRFELRSAEPLQVLGRSGSPRKVVVGLRDGEVIEEALIPAGETPRESLSGQRPHPRRTVCVSSQAGCRFGCAFCASGKAGFRRNLEAGEMVGQVLVAARVWGSRPTHVVFMGIGEPFDNYDAVIRTVRIVNDEEGLDIGARHITISTCGIVPGIERLAGEKLQVELSVSLHAPDQKLREELMPVAKRYPLPTLMKTCAEYVAATNRIITFEYTLIDRLNDSERHARELADLLSGIRSRVNLIPLSPVDEFPGRPSPQPRVQAFRRILMRSGINTTVRRSRGCSIKAACGQLRCSRVEAVPIGRCSSSQ